MIDRLSEIERRYEEVGNSMAQPEVVSDPSQMQRLGREYAELGDVMQIWRTLQATESEIEGARSLLQDSDEEMRELARETLRELEPLRTEQADALKRALAPRDPLDDKHAILEIRAAAGGEEAALFAQELFRMYSLYAEREGWTVDVMDLNETGIGGLKEVIVKVEGPGAYGKLKFESGVHRVQRVPVTESGGRIHTSTATVIVLPEAEEFDVDLRPEDIRVDVYRSSGHGGQGVNTTDSAVRLTHLPTGLVVTCQNERSQLKNKASAMSVLRARLYDLEQQRRSRELGQARKSQVQTGDRSEKIRTYNFPQDRMTDHRIGLTLHNLPSLLNGNIDALIEQLAVEEQAGQLEGATA